MFFDLQNVLFLIFVLLLIPDTYFKFIAHTRHLRLVLYLLIKMTCKIIAIVQVNPSLA